MESTFATLRGSPDPVSYTTPASIILPRSKACSRSCPGRDTLQVQTRACFPLHPQTSTLQLEHQHSARYSQSPLGNIVFPPTQYFARELCRAQFDSRQVPGIFHLHCETTESVGWQNMPRQQTLFLARLLETVCCKQRSKFYFKIRSKRVC